MKRQQFVLVAITAVSLLLLTFLFNALPQEPAPMMHGKWTLVWSDEFDGPDINRDNWTFDLGGSGWGNREWQHYTDRPENARIEDGMLIIEAREELFGGRPYTSARLKTQGLQAFQNGRFEARIKVPEGQGIWPAFWMLGDNFSQRGWPLAGEIDIMENIGREPNTVHGTLHGPGYAGANNVGTGYDLPEPLANDFHIFAIEWEGEEIRWYVDDTNYFTLTAADVPGEWVYDHPFFFLLNVAVGGNWPGYPNSTTQFPQQMQVDYVRVFQEIDG